MTRYALLAALLLSGCAGHQRPTEAQVLRACGEHGANDDWPDTQGRWHVACDRGAVVTFGARR